MTETSDTARTSAAQQCIPEVIDPGTTSAALQAQAASRSAEESVVGELHSYRAVFINGPENEKSYEQEAFEYVQYLENRGFIVKSEPSDSVQQIEDEIKNAAKDAKQLVAVVLMESDSPSDLDRIVSCLRDANASTQKLLISCRISDTESEEKADCMKAMELNDCQTKLTNMIILSIVVKTRKKALKFLHRLSNLKKGKWHLTNCLGQVIQFDMIPKENFAKFRLKTQNGLTSKFVPPDTKLLKDTKDFHEIISHPSYQLERLDSEPIARLKKDANPMENLVYSIKNNKGKKALIIHNVTFRHSNDRPRSYTDFRNLSHVLKLMKFEVTEKVNLRAEEILEAVTDFANDESHGDACVLVIMSHGSRGAICGTDYYCRKENEKYVPVQGFVEEYKIFESMSTGKGVHTKPRLVLVQACRNDLGASQSEGQAETLEYVCSLSEQSQKEVLILTRAIQVGAHQGNAGSPSDDLSPKQTGMIIGHSTSPGHYAFGSDYGSRFILALCATFYEFAHKEDLLSMLTRINFIMVRGFKRPELNGKIQSLQMPCWTVQTHKKFFLVDTSALFEENHTQQSSDVAADSNSNVIPICQ